MAAFFARIKAFFAMIVAFFTGLFGGDSGTNGATEAAMTGSLVTANVYARALSSDEVALLYAQYR